MIEAGKMLATTGDGWMSVINLVVNVLLTVGMLWIGRRVAAFDGLKAALEKKAEELVETKVTLKIGEKFGELRETLAMLTSELKQVNKRLEAGDEAFAAQGDKANRIEVKIASSFADLQRDMERWMLETFVTKSECELRHTKRS